MNLSRLQYYRRVFSAYLGSGRSHLTFWHEVPEGNPRAKRDQLADYYMCFRSKANYAGPFDSDGIPKLDYHGSIGLQYNPIAIAQWGLGNYNRLQENKDEVRWRNVLKAADWLCANLERNPKGLWVWNHHFDWEYRDTLRAPWFSGLAQGQGISLLLRACAGEEKQEQYLESAQRAFATMTLPIDEGGVLFEDAQNNLWIEEYLVDPPTHILNGFLWALWGVYDFSLVYPQSSAETIFDRGVKTILDNLPRFDTGYWSMYEQSGTRLKMLASPFYHHLHIVQLRVMEMLTGNRIFGEFAERWVGYTKSRVNRNRALIEKSAFKLLYY